MIAPPRPPRGVQTIGWLWLYDNEVRAVRLAEGRELPDDGHPHEWSVTRELEADVFTCSSCGAEVRAPKAHEPDADPEVF